MKIPNNEVHETITRETFSRQTLSDRDYLLLFGILHTHLIYLKEQEAESEGPFQCITMLHAGECVAQLWHGVDGAKAKAGYWLDKWISHFDYSGWECLSVEDGKRVEELRDMLKTHPLVQDVVEEG